MWGGIIIPMYRLWLHGLYGLYGPWCPLVPKRLMNLISLSLSFLIAVNRETCSTDEHDFKTLIFPYWLVCISQSKLFFVPDVPATRIIFFMEEMFSVSFHLKLISSLFFSSPMRIIKRWCQGSIIGTRARTHDQRTATCVERRYQEWRHMGFHVKVGWCYMLLT